MRWDVDGFGLGFITARIVVPRYHLRMLAELLILPTDPGKLRVTFASRLKHPELRRISSPRLRAALRAGIEQAFLQLARPVSAWTSQEFNQDRPIWQNKTYLERPRLAKGDGPIVAYRRWASRLYSHQNAALETADAPLALRTASQISATLTRSSHGRDVSPGHGRPVDRCPQHRFQCIADISANVYALDPSELKSAAHLVDLVAEREESTNSFIDHSGRHDQGPLAVNTKLPAEDEDDVVGISGGLFFRQRIYVVMYGSDLRNHDTHSAQVRVVERSCWYLVAACSLRHVQRRLHANGRASQP